jgi:hypothetical protein
MEQNGSLLPKFKHLKICKIMYFGMKIINNMTVYFYLVLMIQITFWWHVKLCNNIQLLSAIHVSEKLKRKSIKPTCYNVTTIILLQHVIKNFFTICMIFGIKIKLIIFIRKYYLRL